MTTGSTRDGVLATGRVVGPALAEDEGAGDVFSGNGFCQAMESVRQ